MTNTIVGAVGVIIIAFIGAMVLGNLPDLNREIVNTLPDTDPDIKTTANKALDVKDQIEKIEDNTVFMKNIAKLFLIVGVPVGVIGGLLFKGLR